MNTIEIQTRNAEFKAELDNSDISNEIWLSLPFTSRTNMLGDEIYFEMILDSNMPEEGRVTVLEKGDIAYWPDAQAFCIFFGPTPLSKEDGKPVSRYPVIKIGKLLGDYSEMESAGDRQKIVLKKSF